MWIRIRYGREWRPRPPLWPSAVSPGPAWATGRYSTFWTPGFRPVRASPSISAGWHRLREKGRRPTMAPRFARGRVDESVQWVGLGGGTQYVAWPALASYRQVLTLPGVRALSLSTFVARLPVTMAVVVLTLHTI